MEASDEAVAKGATSLYLSNMVTLLLGVASFAVITNIFSTAEVGALAALQLLVAGLSVVSTFSIPQGATRFISNLLGIGEGKGASTVMRRSLFAVMALAGAVSIVALVEAWPLARALLGELGTQSLLWLTVLDAWLLAVGQVYLAGFLGAGSISRISLLKSLAFAARSIGAAGSALLGFGLFGVLVAYVVGDALFLAISIPSFPELKGGKGVSVPYSRLLSYSAPLALSAAVYFLTNQIDRLLALLQLGLGDLGTYNVAVRASNVVSYLPASLTMALVPSLSTLLGKGEVVAYRALSRAYARYVSIITMPAAFGMAALAPGIIQAFGTKFFPAADSLSIICIGIGLGSVSSVFESQILSTQDTRPLLWSNVIAFGTFTSLLLILMPRLGYTGGAIGRMVMPLAYAGALACYCKRRGILEVDRGAYAVSLFLSSVMALFLYLIVGWIGGYLRLLASLPLLLLLGIIIYILLLRLMKATRSEDIEFFKRLLPRRLRPLAELVARILGLGEGKDPTRFGR